MKFEKDTLIFSSGRVVEDVSRIGIMLEATTDRYVSEVTEGWDNELFEGDAEGEDVSENPSIKPLTDEERAELADFMIARWQLYKQEAN